MDAFSSPLRFIVALECRTSLIVKSFIENDHPHILLEDSEPSRCFKCLNERCSVGVHDRGERYGHFAAGVVELMKGKPLQQR